MGSVWKAVHQTLGRPFAVKFLKAYGMNASVLEDRFLREARLAASIQHRFVVAIVDFGMTDEGTPYMVMEYLQGESLAQRLTHRPAMLVRDLIRILAQSLVGLEAVHQAGVIHRDLKPENIVLVSEAGGVIPKLVDFGVSRVEHDLPPEERAGAGKLTAPGTTLGTPWYMSPEQAKGQSDIDRRTDLYSMGVILYEALTGKLPFDDPDISVLLRAVTAGGAPTAMERRPEIGPYLSAVVERAMMIDPDRRYANASEMAAALFSVSSQVPELLVCPGPDGILSAPSSIGPVEPASIIADAEISDEIRVRSPSLARAVTVAQPQPRSPWLALAAGVSLAFGLGGLVVMLDRHRPQEAGVGSVVPAELPEVPAASPPPMRIVPASVSSGPSGALPEGAALAGAAQAAPMDEPLPREPGPAAPGPLEAAAAAEAGATPARVPARSRRPPVKKKRPPEMFRSPGF